MSSAGAQKTMSHRFAWRHYKSCRRMMVNIRLCRKQTSDIGQFLKLIPNLSTLAHGYSKTIVREWTDQSAQDISSAAVAVRMPGGGLSPRRAGRMPCLRSSSFRAAMRSQSCSNSLVQ